MVGECLWLLAEDGPCPAQVSEAGGTSPRAGVVRVGFLEEADLGVRPGQWVDVELGSGRTEVWRGESQAIRCSGR